MDADTARPGPPTHFSGDKSVYVREMFSGIAHRYDLLNSILSFYRHYAWRRAAVRLAKLSPGDTALDVCSGTGDFAIELFRAVGPTGLVVGCDFCAPMIQSGKYKIDSASGSRIRMQVADAQALPYPNNTFDCVTVGFGIRNVASISQAFKEMARVARPGGRIVCLEFNTPRNPLLKAMVRFYELKVMPRIGALFSKSDAYTYLPKSIQTFETREALTSMMENRGIVDVRVHDLNFGSVCIHIGVKPEQDAQGTERIL